MITRFSNELQNFLDFMARKKMVTHYPLYQLEKECGFNQGYIGAKRHKQQIFVSVVNSIVNFAEKEGYQFDISYLEEFGLYYVHKN